MKAREVCYSNCERNIGPTCQTGLDSGVLQLSPQLFWDNTITNEPLISIVRLSHVNQLVTVIEIAGHRGDSVDPVPYQRFNSAIGRLQLGQSAEAELRELQREWPDDHVITMCLERLQAADREPLRQMIFEF
jgi:hypothetical protein